MPGTESHARSELYEFGPFRVDAEREVLLREGEQVPLTPKTFQVLLVLIRHSKNVVTKDDLMKAVWPDTFVEETNLTRNVFALRKALGESDQNRYIVTVPGRGYRFAENVRPVTGQEVRIVSANRSQVEVKVEETTPWPRILFAVILLLLAITAIAFRLFWRRAPALTQKDTVVLADFANSTGDPVFDGTLRQGMEAQLEQSPFLSLISDERIQHTLYLMGKPADQRLTTELALELCERTGSAVLLDGSISSLGSEYALGLRARDCRTGAILDEEQVQAAKKEDVLNALSHMASRFRIRVGESLATVQEHDSPLAEATTPSLEALKAYSGARMVAFSTGQAAAIPLLQRAIEIDPNFAMAYAFLGRMYGDIWEPILSAQSTLKAYQLRNHASEPERLFIQLSYELQVTGNLEKAQQTGELWSGTYPRQFEPHGFLSWIYQQFGNYAKSAQEAQAAIELDPDFTPGYVNLAWAQLFANRPDDAEKTLQQASQRKLEIPELLVLQYCTSFLKNDNSGMERAAMQSEAKAGAEDWMADLQASVDAYFGRLNEARRMSRRAVELARQSDEAERAAIYQAGAAVREALFGNAQEARRDAMAALGLSKARDVEYGAAFSLVLSGDFSRSQTLANDLEKRFPEDTLVRFTYLPELRSLSALERGDPSSAIDALQATVPYELGIPGSWSGFFGNLYPIYVRGEALLALHQGREAAAEFEKILDHPGIVAGDPVGALARLQLGRACALSGDKIKAKSSYQAFLTLWKDADPNIPIFSQAKAAYAALQ